jgi:flagella basal body P-ring formation protein FlgA
MLFAVPMAIARAAPERAALNTDQLLSMVQVAVEQAAQQVMSANPGVRVQTQLGSFAPQLKLAPCMTAQPHFQPGTKAWGEIRIGLRCTEGLVRWNIYVPATVRVFGPAWVSAAALPPGHVLTEADLLRQESELTGEPGVLPTQLESMLGRSLISGLRAGQALRGHHLRARQWFAAGQAVTLVAKGPGFAVTSEGVAVTPGLEGQITQIRLDSGRVVQGMPVGARRVEVAL